LEEVVSVIDPGFEGLEAPAKEERIRSLSMRLSPTRMMNLTEFGRAVHAEMEALLAALRIGVNVPGSHLYTTTFPCHNCAKHIVNAGISRVVYIEPYPKSLAMELHDDAIRLDEPPEPDDYRLSLECFVGVAPRRYPSAFAMVTPDGRRYPRKDGRGAVLRDALGLRISEPVLNYIQRESSAALVLREFVDSEQGELDLD
jgi:tRNA(Arg) A34 adenosine deaminase TadA